MIVCKVVQDQITQKKLFTKSVTNLKNNNDNSVTQNHHDKQANHTFSKTIVLASGLAGAVLAGADIVDNGLVDSKCQ